jgi:hypothetical protein
MNPEQHDLYGGVSDVRVPLEEFDFGSSIKLT